MPGPRATLREENSTALSEIPCLKPVRPYSLSMAVTEFLEQMMLTMPRCTGTKILHPHPNSAFAPILYTYKPTSHATPLPVFKRKHGLEGKDVHEGFMLGANRDMVTVWLGGSLTIQLALDKHKTS